jgi:hypothetical protein
MYHLKNAQCGKRVPADRRTKLATAKTWIKMKNPKASAAARAIDGTF